MNYHSKRNFTLLSLGQFISVIGDRISTAVFLTIAITIIGNLQSTYQSSLLVAFQILPFFLFGYFFGLVADRVEKRKILIFADIGRALVIISLFFFHESLIYLYFSVFMIGTLSSLFEPARKAILPFLVPKGKLVFYNKFYATLEILAMLIGLGVGTFLLDKMSIEKALILDILTYIVSMALLLLIKYHDEDEVIKEEEKKKHIKSKSSKYISDLKEGWNYLKQNDNVKYVIINIILWHFLASALFFTTASDFAQRTFELSNFIQPGSHVTLTLLIVAIGAMLSPLVKMLIKTKKDSKLSSQVFKIGASIFYLLYILSIVFTIEYYYYIVLIAFFFVGIIAGLQYIRFLYIIHLNCEKKYLGRVVSIAEITWSLSIVVGILIGAWINQMFTYQFGFLAIGLIYSFGVLSLYLTKNKITW